MAPEDSERMYLEDVIRETKALISHFDALGIEGDTEEERIDQRERRKGVMEDLKSRLKELEEEVAGI